MPRADLTPDDHVQDIVNFIKWRDSSEVVLVGHSCGGMVVTGVAGQIPDQLSSLVYLDAFVPEESGVSLFARGNPARMAGFQNQIDAGAIALEPDTFDRWSDNPRTLAGLKERCTPQPARTFTLGVSLTGRENEISRKHFILCALNKPSAFVAEHDKVSGRKGWSLDKIDTLHDAMADAPVTLADTLAAFAAGNERGNPSA